MKYLLDTDHLSILQWQTGPEFVALSNRMTQHQPLDFALCLVSFHEQTLGCHNLVAKAKNAADVIKAYSLFDRVLDSFAAAQVLPFDVASAARFDGLRAQRVRLATMDLRIAAIALSRGLILLTRNLRDFRKVPGLPAKDWTL